MNEIERAIEYIESMFPIDEQEGEALSTALKLLRAELTRQENAPLTADELAEMVDKPIFIVYESPLDHRIVRKWSIPYMVHEGTAHCTDGENWYPAQNCKIYRYEPKGEIE